jgi:hypothetical protein
MRAAKQCWRALVPLAPALALSAAAADVPAATVAQLPTQMGLQPGNWHSAETLIAVDALPAPPGGADDATEIAALKGQVNQTHQFDECLAAAPGKPNDVFVPGMHLHNDCRFEEAVVAAGRWHLKAQCRESGGRAAELKVEGHYAPTALDSIAEVAITSRQGPHVRLTVATTSKRTGPCGPIVIPVH